MECNGILDNVCVQLRARNVCMLNVLTLRNIQKIMSISDKEQYFAF